MLSYLPKHTILRGIVNNMLIIVDILFKKSNCFSKEKYI